MNNFVIDNEPTTNPKEFIKSIQLSNFEVYLKNISVFIFLLFLYSSYSNPSKTIQYPIISPIHGDGLIKVNNNEREERKHTLKTLLSSIQYELGIVQPNSTETIVFDILNKYFDPDNVVTLTTSQIKQKFIKLLDEKDDKEYDRKRAIEIIELYIKIRDRILQPITMIYHISPIEIYICQPVYISIQNCILYVSNLIHKEKYVLFHPDVSVLENISFFIYLFILKVFL